ncbi:MAG: trypsin-like serine peptidase [Chthoniobacteraceae bacterium]
MMWSTYPLATQKGAATGFVIARRDPRAPGGLVPVVFTSAHVLASMEKGPLYIAIRVPGADDEPDVAVLELQTQGSKAPQFVRHPQFDIGAFELKIPAEVADLVQLPSFIEERELARQRVRLRAGTDVSFLGFPDVLPGTTGAFPVLRSGKVASYPTGASKGQRRFLINADVYPGDSGAPVFISRRGNRPELVGIIVERIGKDRRSFAHLAVAIDSIAIHETLRLLDQREGRSPEMSGRSAHTGGPKPLPQGDAASARTPRGLKRGDFEASQTDPQR